MVLAPTHRVPAKSRPAAPDSTEPALWYSLYGMRVRSDVGLPLPPIPVGGPESPDVEIRRFDGVGSPSPTGDLVSWEPGDRCTASCPHPGPDCPIHLAHTRVWRDDNNAWTWNRAIGTIHARPDARRIDVYALPRPDERPLGLMLACAMMLFVLQRLGRPSLHSSAVVLDGAGAVVFLGRAGHGKSTMAAGLLRRGAALITDDALPLSLSDDGVCGGPSLPLMRVWPETASRGLGLDEDLPNLLANFDKRLLALDGRFAVASAPARVRAIYLLDRYDPAETGHTDCSIEQLGKSESLALLTGATITRAFMVPHDDVELLPLYARLAIQAPLRLLRYPSGFEHQDAVYARLRDDLGEP
jgi:hypothetical protein